MLTTAELRRLVSHFGVPEQQIRRDHLLSHVLQALARLDMELVFFGGTALCRTHLVDWRLSEDIDLLTSVPTALAGRLQADLPDHLRREFPGSTIEMAATASGMAGRLDHDGLGVRVQLVELDSSYRRYPVRMHDVTLRFDDLPASVALPTPTASAAAAMKLNAWAERAAPRDLCDLFGLAEAGLLGDEAIAIAADVGWHPAHWMFDDDRVPSAGAWNTALGQQMAVPPDPAQALRTVREHVFRING